MAIGFFEYLHEVEGLVKRVNVDTVAMQQELLTLAELFQIVAGFVAPPEPERTAAQTELLLESRYEDLEVLRFHFAPAAAHHEARVYRLDGEVNAEIALAFKLFQKHCTKMVLARCFQRHGDLRAR